MKLPFAGTDLKRSQPGKQTHNSSWPSFFVRNYFHIFSILEVLVDWMAIFFAALVGYAVFLARHPVEPDWPRYVVVSLVMAMLGLLLFERFDLYRKQVSLMNLIETRKIVRAVSVLFIVFAISSNFLSFAPPFTFLVYSSICILLFTLVERMLFFKFQQSMHLRGVSVRRVLLLGAGQEARLLYENICRAPKFGYFVVGFLDEDQQQIEIARDWFAKGRKTDPLFSTSFSALEEIVRKENVDEIFMCNSFVDSGGGDLKTMHEFCMKNEIKFRFAPIVSGYYPSQVKVTDIGGINMISFGEIPISLSESISKRIFDLIFAGVSLICLSPVFLWISLLIYRNDAGGPVIFTQMRVGKDGVQFPMYKFRTMHVDTPQYGRSPKCSDDPRITKFGRFLRRTSLDELPQLFNVLRGEMSMVGPRPEMPFIVENEYNDLYRQRLRVKPGITGVWQISGDRTREIHENISYDIFYIENRSLLLDTIILIRTVIFAILAMKTH